MAAVALVLQIASSDARKLAILRKKNGNGSGGPAFLAPSGSLVEVTPSWYGPEDGGYGASILWHRGGSDQDEDEVDGPLDEVEGAEQQTREETKIQISLSSVETSPPSSATPSELAKKASPQSNPNKKKSNAVGDPDGNSSDGETSDDEDELREDLEELERMILEQERLRRESGEEGDGSKDFDTLIELAGRRDEMRRRISEMEEELSRRKAEDALSDDESLDAGEDNATDDEAGESTSYSLTGTNLPREDGILKRSRRYKRGSIFKSKSARSRNASSTGGADAGKRAGAEAIPTTVDGTTFDSLLISALGPLVHLPPPHPRLPCADGSVDLKTVDIAARRRLDRRTLYHGLLAEMGGSHTHVKSDGRNSKSEQSDGKSSEDEKKGKEKIDSMIRRRYLDPETSRQLKGALSLACQPSWRKRLVPSSADNDYNESEMWEGHRTGVCLYPDAIEEDDDEDEIAEVENQAPRFFGPPPSDAEEVPIPAAPKRVWRATMAQQETAGMALAHSLGCGLALIDDELLSGVRERVAQSLEELSEKSEEKQTINPEELRNGSLIGHLCRLASDGKFGQNAECRYGRISDRMARDMELGLDDDNDDLAVESLRLMREDERSWFEPIEAAEPEQTTREDGGEDEKTVEESSEDGEAGTLPLVLFLRSDSSPSLLRSKSSVESLARQTLSDDGIHLLMVGGNGVDASSSSLPSEARQGVAAVGRKRTSSGMGEFQGQSHQQGGGVPFAFMSNHPPGSPEFNAQMQVRASTIISRRAKLSRMFGFSTEQY